VFTFSYTATGADPLGWAPVIVSVVDLAGNPTSVTALDILAIDIDAPTGTIEINDGDFHTTSPIVRLNLAGDDGTSGTGVSEMRFSDDGAAWTAWEAFATTRSYVLPAPDGLKTVHVQYRDGVLNESVPTTDSIVLDTMAPDSAVIAPIGTFAAPVFLVEWTALDLGSGVDTVSVYWFKVGSGLPHTLLGTYPYTIASATFDATPHGFGTYAFYSVAVDVLGNVEAAPALPDVTAVFVPNLIGQIFYEPFQYSAGFLTDVTTNWVSPGGALDYRVLNQNSLTFPNLRASRGRVAENRSDPAAQDVSRGIGAFARRIEADMTLYTSMLINVSSIPTNGTDYFFHFHDTAFGTFHRGRVYVTQSGGGYRVGVRYTSFGDVQYATGTFNLNTTYFLVLKVTMSATGARDKMDLFVNPVPGSGEPFLPAVSCVSAGSAHDFDALGIGGVGMRQSTNTINAIVDEMRVGDTWASVTPSASGVTETGVGTWELYE
jgi:hypothetical protein